MIDGKALAAKVRDEVAAEVEELGDVGLTTVLVGDDPASHVYITGKQKAATGVGIHANDLRLPADISQEELLELLAGLNADDSVDGLLVQLPLPAHIDETQTIEAIDPAKDIDGLHPMNAGSLYLGRPRLVPATPLGIMRMLAEHHVEQKGARGVVVGRSNIVGKPMAQLLIRASCTVTVAHSRTRDLPGAVRRADIVVAAVGRPELIRGDWLKEGATVIDVGQERVEQPDGTRKLLGDVAFDEALEVAGAITPVPGGVGPMTIACLLRNTLVAAHRRANLKDPEGL
jgi:methylenetetrahydrofolate dehydrogenase (NADP+) / methenyltetrahydrofolate cyclohydrolase